MGPTALRGIRATGDTLSNVESQVFTPYKFGSTAGDRTPDLLTTRPTCYHSATALCIICPIYGSLAMIRVHDSRKIHMFRLLYERIYYLPKSKNSRPSRFAIILAHEHIGPMQCKLIVNGHFGCQTCQSL